KLIEVDNECKLRTFYEKHMATEVAADALGEEWKGYVVRISGGNDKQGFPMKQGVLTHGRVRLLLSKGHSCYRPRRTGERKRKSVRGCIVDANLSVLNLVIVKKGEKDIPGLTDTTVPQDDVCQYVVRKPLNKEGKKPRTTAPKIQRLVTPRVLQHKRRRIALKKQQTKKNKEEAAEYAKLLAKRMKEAKEKRQEQIAKRRNEENRSQANKTVKILQHLSRDRDMSNHSSSTLDFILLGLSSNPQMQKPLFAIFFIMYLVTVVGNVLIILAIHSDSRLHTPMYFFLSNLSFMDICFTTVIVPKMLVNLLSETKTISYMGCLVQMYFFIALANTDSYLLASMAIDRLVAICNPLHYDVVMRPRCCLFMLLGSCTISHLHALFRVLLMSRLSFCASHVIKHFFCDTQPVLKLSCSDTSSSQIVVMTETLAVIVTPFLCILFSYLRIIVAVLRIPSAAGKWKAFSTCGSHLTVVSLFYGSVIYVYFRPLSMYSVVKDR
ncbi:hypothetical protein A6R68_24006, partial [Neotoma lepida]